MYFGLPCTQIPIGIGFGLGASQLILNLIYRKEKHREEVTQYLRIRSHGLTKLPMNYVIHVWVGADTIQCLLSIQRYRLKCILSKNQYRDTRLKCLLSKTQYRDQTYRLGKPDLCSLIAEKPSCLLRAAASFPFGFYFRVFPTRWKINPSPTNFVLVLSHSLHEKPPKKFP